MPRMPLRGFCEHGKVWTTCPVCGREVIAAAGKRGDAVDEFGELRKKPKRAAAGRAEEGGEEPRGEEEETES